MDKDPYYKLRVVGTASSIGALIAGIVLVVIFSKALPASTIVSLFGFAFIAVLLEILLVFRTPGKGVGNFSMDSPRVSLIMAIISGIVVCVAMRALTL